MEPVSNVRLDPLSSGTTLGTDAGPGVGVQDADALAKLQTRTLDSLAGFEKMLEKAEPHFRSTVRFFIDLHRQQADALVRILMERGHQPDADGSWMSTMQRAVIAVRSMVDEIDEDTLPQVRMGEEQILDLFDDAIAETTDERQRSELLQMRATLCDLTDRLIPRR